MNNIDKQYQNLLQDILDNGVEKKDRTGTGTISVFGRQIRHKMSEGFPLLTTKKMAWKTMVTELLWFLRGDTNIKYLVDNDCNIWNGDAYINYLNNSRPDKSDKDFHKTRFLISKEEFINKIKTDDEFAKKFGELGPIYGKQWRNWVRKTTRDEKIVEPGVYETSIDQIANLINDLKTNPDSRRLMVNAWNVGELDQMVLPPCHYGFQVYTRELTWEEQVQWVMKNTDVEMENLYIVEEIAKPSTPKRVISLMWNQRSVDTFLGLPFNIASYGLLLEIIAKAVNMVPDELIGNLGDVHLYSNHIEQAKEQIGRKYNHEERHELLKKAMGDFYQTAVDEQVPFGGGLSEYYDSYKIPHHSREPYKLPKLIFGKTDEFWKSLSENISLFGHLDPVDFTVQDYQSHPTIKAPLSN
jgi:thymidylate synthase